MEIKFDVTLNKMRSNKQLTSVYLQKSCSIVLLRNYNGLEKSK